LAASTASLLVVNGLMASIVFLSLSSMCRQPLGGGSSRWKENE
jgi:hypothetical protein